MTVVLRLSRVSKDFGTLRALDGVSFVVHKGEVVGFVGANGAGKTTTIGAILGFIRPSEGTLQLFGHPVMPESAHILHRRIGYAAGDMELPPRLTGGQYLAFVSRHSGGNHDQRLADLIKRFQPQLDKMIGTLSRGNKQKIALIAAFMTNPELIILDEPTSGLDPVMQEVFLSLIREVQAAGTTVFMSSHYLAEVADVCSRVILMRGGKIVRDLSSEEMRASSGKHVRVVTGYKSTKPPTHASDTTVTYDHGRTTLSFVYKGAPADLQVWLAGLKQLHDIEITEHDLEGVFKSLYEDEGGPS